MSPAAPTDMRRAILALLSDQALTRRLTAEALHVAPSSLSFAWSWRQLMEAGELAQLPPRRPQDPPRYRLARAPMHGPIQQHSTTQARG